MNPKLLIAATTAALALAAAPGLAPAQAASHKTCAHTKGATTITPTKQVVVYRTKVSEVGAAIYACWRPTGRTMLLHTNTGGADVTDVIFDDRVAISGHVIAFHVAASGDHNYDYVRAFDLRTGIVLHASRSVRRASGMLPYPLPPTAIATNDDGAMVWLSSGALRVTDSGGNRIVATTVAGPITQLSVTATKAHWTQGGRDHTARLAQA